MADKTGISWTDATWNPIAGCSVVSPGCTNCYAMRDAGVRLAHHPKYAGLTAPSKRGPVWTGEVRFWPPHLEQPLRWTRPRRIFVNSMSDLFHAGVPDEWIDNVFAVMGACEEAGLGHKFQVLTKRAARMHAYMWSARAKAAWNSCRMGPNAWPPRNVWLGVTVEDQTRAEERIPLLMTTPAAVRFISFEPLLGPVEARHLFAHCPTHDFTGGFCVGDCGDRRHIDWAIVGGESGPDARPMHPDWARSLRDQCAEFGIPFFMKQMAGVRPKEVAIPPDLRIQEFPAQESAMSP